MLDVSQATGASSPTSFPFLIKGYLMALKVEGKSPHTLEFYGGNLSRFCRYKRERGYGDDIRGVDTWKIREFLSYVGDERQRWGVAGNGSESCRREASRTTVFHYYATLRHFFSWLQRERLILENPVEGIRLKRPKSPPMKGYTSEEVAKLMRLCALDFRVAPTKKSRAIAARNEALVLAFLSTGLRLSEMASLLLEDLDLETGEVMLRKGKGGKGRRVGLVKEALSSLLRYLRHRVGESSYLWLNEEGRPLKPSGVASLVDRLCQRAGVKPKGCHAFRRTWATELFRAGAGIRQVQILGGWTNLEMPHRYSQMLSEDDAIQSLNAHNPLSRLLGRDTG